MVRYSADRRPAADRVAAQVDGARSWSVERPWRGRSRPRPEVARAGEPDRGAGGRARGPRHRLVDPDAVCRPLPRRRRVAEPAALDRRLGRRAHQPRCRTRWRQWCDADGIDYAGFPARHEGLARAIVRRRRSAATRSTRWSAARWQVPDFERELGSSTAHASMAGRSRSTGLLTRMFAGLRRRLAADARGGPPRQGGRRCSTALLSNSWGNELPARGLGRAVRRRRHLRRGRAAQARAGDLPADRAAGSGSHPGNASSSMTSCPTSGAPTAVGMVGVHHVTPQQTHRRARGAVRGPAARLIRADCEPVS